jgi:hypothetical protein
MKERTKMSNEFKSWHDETLGAKAVAALVKNNFQATYCQTGQEAADKILALIPAEATVGAGGSWTVLQLGLLDTLEGRGNTVLTHGKPGLKPEEAMDIRRRQLTCDVFLTGSNALTLDGKLVNTDATGNRVGAMTFGPKKVIIVVGVNKIVRDVAEAEKRIKLYAAPINNKRLKRPNPCVQTGECMDCQAPTRICSITTIMSKKPVLTDIHVFVVGEELGF